MKTTLVCSVCLVHGFQPTGNPLGYIAMHEGTSYCRNHLAERNSRDGMSSSE